MNYLKELTEKWCEDQIQDSERRINDTGAQLESQYQKLQQIFVDIPSKPSHQEQINTRTGSRVHKELRKETFHG
jgi:hypothetical protein